MATTVKVTQESIPVSGWRPKIDSQHASPGIEHTAHVSRALLASRPGKMVQHQRAQDDVEMASGKGERLDDLSPKGHVDPRLHRLSLRASNHLRRRVDSVDHARGTDAPLRRDGEGSRPAPHV